MDNPRKSVTLKDIAAEAGISPTAVSKVLNSKGGISRETEERVRAIAERMGYTSNFVAKSLRTNSTRTLGVVISDSTHAFFGSVIKGAEEEAAKRGYSIILVNTNRSRETEKKAIRTLMQKRVDGLLLASSMLTQPQDAEYLDALGVPYVYLIRRSEKPDAPFVGNDNVLGAFNMVDYLLKTGSKRIHFLNMTKDSTSSAERLKGYMRALETHGVPWDPALVYNMRPDIESGYTMMRSLLDAGEAVTAVFCGCDTIAVGAMEALFEKGIAVPGEVRVCGYDDIEFAAYLRRPLTTVRQPKEVIGVKGVELLLSRVEEGADALPPVVILKSELVVRQST